MKRISFLILFLYLLPYLYTPLHLLEEKQIESNCPACHHNETNSDESGYRQPCSPEKPCNDPTHHHHNHPIHDSHDCQICNTVFHHNIINSDTELAVLPQNTYVTLFHITGIVISHSPFTTESIRGPPVVS